MFTTITIIIVLVAILLSLIRVFKGPTNLDRSAAASAITLKFLIIILLLVERYSRAIFLDIALIYGLLLFVDLLIMSKYFGAKKLED